MTLIRTQDVIQSVAEALQYISYYHPADFVRAVSEAYEMEESAAAKDAMAQILINSRLCAEGKRPICQDTGIVTVFLKVGMQLQWEGDLSLTEMINEGVRQAYRNPDNVLRASILSDPAGARKNTGDNTPAVIHTEVVPGDKFEIKLAAKGGGSENKAKMVMLNPSDSIVDWVEATLPTMGAGWCPPGASLRREPVQRGGRKEAAYCKRLCAPWTVGSGSQSAVSCGPRRPRARPWCRRSSCAAGTGAP